MSKPLNILHALGRAGLPATVSVGGTTYSLQKTVKHDFWAATGFYLEEKAEGGGRRAEDESDDLIQRSIDTSTQRLTKDGSTSLAADDSTLLTAGCRLPTADRIVVKINRRIDPLTRLAGRYLALREVRAYSKLADVPNVPALVGRVTSTGFAHAFAVGEPLSKSSKVPDAFFDELMSLVKELHRRGMAYVDLNKPENVILGDDGRPYLIDFQIHFDAAAWWPGSVGRWLLEIFHRGDVYHVLKHKRRIRPDLLTDEERVALEHRGFFIRLHRTITKPYFRIRRPIMRWLKSSGRVMDAGSN